MAERVKKRLIPKSLKRRDEHGVQGYYVDEGVQAGDDAITLPNKIEHLIHVDGSMSGLPPSWANKLAELGYYAEIDTPAINQHKQRSGERSRMNSTLSTASSLSIPELNIADEDEDWSGGVLRALERSSITEKKDKKDKKAKRSSNIIQSTATSRRSSTMNVESTKKTQLSRRPATADTPTRSIPPTPDSASLSQQRWSPPRIPSKNLTSASKQRWEPKGGSKEPSTSNTQPSTSTSTTSRKVPSSPPQITVPRSFAAAQDQYLSNVDIRKEIDASHGVKNGTARAADSKAPAQPEQGVQMDPDADVYGGMEEEVLDSPQDVGLDGDDTAGTNWDMVKSPSGLSLQLSPLQIDNQTFELSESVTSPPPPAPPSSTAADRKVETRKRSRSSLIVLDRSRRQVSIASTPGSVVDDEDDLTAAYLRDIQGQRNLDDLAEGENMSGDLDLNTHDQYDEGLEFTMLDGHYGFESGNSGLGIDVYGRTGDDGHESDSSTSTAKVATTSSTMVFDIPTNETTPELEQGELRGVDEGRDIGPLESIINKHNSSHSQSLSQSHSRPVSVDIETQLKAFASRGRSAAIYPLEHRMIIATGMSGNVYAAHQKALKIVKRTRESSRFMNLSNELSIIRSLHHPNILPISDMYLDGDMSEPDGIYATLVMPLMTRSLTDIIALMDHGLQLSEKQVGRVVHDILSALEALRQNRILHRDVRSDTIMIAQDGTSVLTDFANAVQCDVDEDADADDGCCIVDDVISAPFWLAPELVEEGGKYTHKSDVWSLIATTYEMVTGMPPYAEYDESALFRKLVLGLPDLPHETSNKVREFVVRTANTNPSLRPSANYILDTEPLVHPSAISHREEISLVLEIANQLEGELTL